MTTPTKWIRVSEIADRLSVANTTVRSWIHDGHLRIVDIGVDAARPTYRVSLDSLQTFLARRGMTAEEFRTAFPCNGKSGGVT